MERESIRNWDYVDPKVIGTFDELKVFSQQLNTERTHATGQQFLVFKDKIKLQRSFQKTQEKLQHLLASHKDKMLDYFDDQLDYMSKRSVPLPNQDFSCRSINYHSLQRSTAFTNRQKRLNRNLSADDLANYDVERPCKLPSPAKHEICVQESVMHSETCDGELSRLDHSEIHRSEPSHSNSFEADVSVREYLQKQYPKQRSTSRGRYTCRDSDSFGANTTMYPRDSAAPRDSEQMLMWQNFNEQQETNGLRFRIETLEQELEAKNQEIAHLRTQVVDSFCIRCSEPRKKDESRSSHDFSDPLINLSTNASTTESSFRSWERAVLQQSQKGRGQVWRDPN